MGVVRLHRDDRIGRDVAMKTMLAEPGASHHRFVREARLQGHLEHPAIVPVYDVGIDATRRPFFTMKRVRGDTLAMILLRLAVADPAVRGEYSRRKLLSAYSTVCLALHYAHSRGVVHRDLKPENIMLGRFGEVYVLDWGVARVLGDAEIGTADGIMGERLLPTAVEPTKPGEILGTPMYLAPERFPGAPNACADIRSDIFSLGLILYEILTLRAFRKGLPVTAIYQERTSPRVVRPSDIVPDVSPELDAICAKAAANDPSERYADAHELAMAIERFLDGDRDLELRRLAAMRHTQSAEALARSGTATQRVDAMREALRAVTLDPGNTEAQRLLFDLAVNVPNDPPPDAAAEWESEARQTRSQAAKITGVALLSWLVALPVAALIGVKEWLAVGATGLLCGLALMHTFFMWRSGRETLRDTVILGLLLSGVVALVSCYMGPFVLGPTCAAAASVFLAVVSRPRERLIVAGFVSIGATAPFVIELLGLLSPAYRFESGQVAILERAVALPAGPTLGGMLYSTLAFIILPVIIVGRVRDRMAAAQRRLFLQAWQLRQLFGQGAPR